MNLSNRLRIRDYTSLYGSRACFKHGKFHCAGYDSLILFVLNRYSLIFGDVTPKKCDELKMRLAEKYCNAHYTTLKSLGITHIKRKLRKISIDQFQSEAMMLVKIESGRWECIRNLTAEYETSKTFCYINKQYSGWKNIQISYSQCDCCGLSFPNVFMKNRNKWFVCKSKTCRTVATFFDRGGSIYPLINVIAKISKKGGSNEDRSKLEKHFI